ncbi:hypothetical protein OG298_31975 [Streptomyces sp. NBC_01005]|uniref:Uncharacterized protein n=1 Tax=Streptomyces sanglieri TaxID=193460 RepID=A0ABW2X2R9_9ACTN|nr:MULTISPECIES: hypothetical protein [unclassified Streptomyces]MDV9195206.1 hypothetical protein [Streptomyces sp. Wh19]WSP49849.1 hypothetical protein OG348_30530 [Streptomyces sp. NBC_01243]WSW08630.1 hypothetical protein OG298_31975 [Streptomyces sp. NBC_01005]WTC98137.1 hypothetical protein OH736_31985 [Streptomyces sp. NBC_01650]
MSDQSDVKPRRRRWTDAERWQVCLAMAGLFVAIIAAVGQFMQ